MTAQFARTPYRGRSGGSTVAEPHAALLIDFDNVTMGIRSDLTKELKNLLNSDIIKGKVAVQRAYADWRRYPQYIVPLAESSVDLIFAPAYGSAKKNATDIRLAIDALELVFTRSEIGTFILLSGDSDFSSLVLKLKEYGKYVIGVGIRESASDLLVQNCDEYYSYSALTGLTRAGDEAPVISEDPWELVDLAVRQMIENDDVMRSDRLKQVLLEMDPAFDEKALGFQKFNKFLQEASTRGILSLRKQENGQFEVGAASEGAAEAAEAAAGEGRESRRGRSRRGRGRREEGRTRDERKDQLDLPERTATEAAAGPAAVAAVEPAPVEAPAAKAAAVVETRTAAESESGAATPHPSSSPRSAPDRTERSGQAGTVAEEPSAPRERSAARGADKAGKGEGDLAASYDLLRRAAADLVRKNGPAVRDSDVKRRMLELEAGWDESAHGFSKFSRFLRQAHDAQVVTLRRADGGNYDVLLGEGDGQGEAPAETRGGRRDRIRGRGRERTGPAPGGAQVSEPPRRQSEPAQTPAAAGATQATMAAERPARASAEATLPAPAAGKTTGQAVSRPGTSAAIGFRRGSRGRAAPAGPPPLLEGQTARVSSSAAAATDTAPAAAKTTAGKRARKAPAKKVTSKGTSRTAAKWPSDAPPPAAAKTAASGAVNAAALGLPTDAGEIANYITAYRGVGPKSVQSLIGAFGAGHVFEALETKQNAVREVMGAARADRLLEAWSKDVAARRAGDSATAGASPAPAAAAARSGAAKKSARRGGRRGRGGQTAGK